MSNNQRYEEASRRAASLIQNAVQCLLPVVLENNSSETAVTFQTGRDVRVFPTNQNPCPVFSPQPSTSSSPVSLTAPVAVRPIQPLVCPGPSREDMIQSRMSALFEPYPTKMAKRSIPKRPYETPWSHDFFCLSDPDADLAPSLEERCTLQSLGLGRKRVTFQNNNGTHVDFVETLTNTYSQLADAGGFKLMRCGRNRVLFDIPMPSSGYSVRYLRLESGLNKALAYIVPLQKKLAFTEECKPNHSDTVMEKCKSCHEDFPLNKLENHFNHCRMLCIDLTREEEIETETDETENELEQGSDEDERVEEETTSGGEESDDLPLQSALEESFLNQQHQTRALALHQTSPEAVIHEQATSLPNERNIGSVLAALERAIDETDDSPVSYISVCRSNIWMGVTLALRRKSFQPHWRISVKFMDDIGVAEGAVDTGGPKRELFTLVLEYLHDSALFVGPEGKKLLSVYSSAMDKDEYFYAGMIIAMSLVHGGPAPKFLSRTLYSALTESPEKTTVTIEEVPDLTLKENLKRLCSGEVPEDLDDIIDMAGARRIITTPEDAQKMALDIAHWYILGRTRSAFERFKDGLKSLGVYSAMLENKEPFLDVMCHHDNPITTKHMEMFQPVLHSTGSNKRSTENLLLCLWENFILEANDGACDVSLENILFFSTGVKSIPPLGLRPSPCLRFLHDAEGNGELSKYPKANTCTNTLYLPTVHTSYEEFQSHMVFAIGASAGFGLP